MTYDGLGKFFEYTVDLVLTLLGLGDAHGGGGQRQVQRKDEFCMYKDEFCIKNELKMIK